MARIHGRTVQKCLHDPDNHDGVITHLEPDILECEVKWALWTKLMEVMELQLSYFKSWKMMLWKCCTQHACNVFLFLSTPSMSCHPTDLMYLEGRNQGELGGCSPWKPVSQNIKQGRKRWRIDMEVKQRISNLEGKREKCGRWILVLSLGNWMNNEY